MIDCYHERFFVCIYYIKHGLNQAKFNDSKVINAMIQARLISLNNRHFIVFLNYVINSTTCTILKRLACMVDFLTPKNNYVISLHFLFLGVFMVPFQGEKSI